MHNNSLATNGVYNYLHTDHLGSTVMTTDTTTINNPSSDQRYYAYGRQRDVDPVVTDHQFTGQKLDGTGLQYYNARYYDPTLGTFISPDSIVPDAGTLIDYNRYAYSRANPLNFNDPTGHETDKPENWPDWFLYAGDLPDGLTFADLEQWISENNIPTTVGGQVGFDANARWFVGVTGSAEAGWLFNWYSGELVIDTATSSGINTGFAGDLSLGVHGGITAIAGAKSIAGSVEGYSLYNAINAEGELLGTVGISGVTQRGLSADPDAGVLTINNLAEPLIDPVFNRTVDSVALNATFGADASSWLLDGGYSTGVSQTTVVKSFDVYAPIESLYHWWFGD